MGTAEVIREVRSDPARGRRVGPKRPRGLQTPLWVPVLFLAPAFAALLVLRLAPATSALVDSFSRTHPLRRTTEFVGLENYAALLASPDFRNTLLVTIGFTLVINPLQIAVSFLLAVLFTRKFRGSGIWRSLIIIPVAVPPAVSAIMWSAIYRPDGLANAFLERLGIPPQPFLTSATQAMPSIIILLSWIGVGYWMLFLIAGINDIPEEYYEAAALDGASWWRQVWSITLPLCRRPLAFVLVADTVSNLLVFAPVQILTKGGPDGSTSLLMYDIFTRAYTFGNLSQAQAAVTILVVITLIAVSFQFALLRGKD